MKTLSKLIIITIVLFSSCKKDNNEDSDFNPNHLHGAFITCEGNFNANNGVISFLDSKDSTITKRLFQSVNNRGLGDIVQSFTVAGDKGYIVVNNSQKVEVVDMETFESVGIITGFDYPRYFLQVDENRAYLTNGSGEGKVYVIDLEADMITDSITVGNGAEDMKKVGDKVFVANSGGWGADNTVSVINAESNEVIKTIEVGDIPVILEVDINDDIWLICKGLSEWNGGPTNAKLVKINRLSLNVEKQFDFGGSLLSFGSRLLSVSPDGRHLYFENGGIFKMSIEADELPTEPFITVPNNNFYGIAVNPSNGNIFGFEQDWNGGEGKIYQYNSEGAKLNEYEVGVGPNGVVFY